MKSYMTQSMSETKNTKRVYRFIVLEVLVFLRIRVISWNIMRLHPAMSVGQPTWRDLVHYQMGCRSTIQHIPSIEAAKFCCLGNSLKACCIPCQFLKCFQSYTWNNKKIRKGQKYAKVRSVQKRHLHWLNMCFLISSDHNNNWLMLFRQVRVCFKNMFVPAKLILLLHIGHEAREHVFPRSALEFVRLQQVKVAMLHPL